MQIAIATFKESSIDNGLEISDDEKSGQATADDSLLISELRKRGHQVDEVP